MSRRRAFQSGDAQDGEAFAELLEMPVRSGGARTSGTEYIQAFIQPERFRYRSIAKGEAEIPEPEEISGNALRRAAAESEFHVFETQSRRSGGLASHVSVAIHLTM
jgi:hypothetical protein